METVAENVDGIIAALFPLFMAPLAMASTKPSVTWIQWWLQNMKKYRAIGIGQRPHGRRSELSSRPTELVVAGHRQDRVA